MAKGKAGHGHLVDNLPALLGAASAIAAGLHGYLAGLPTDIVYRNILAFLVVCFVLGLVARKTIRSFEEEAKPVPEESEAAEPSYGELLYAGDEGGQEDGGEAGGLNEAGALGGEGGSGDAGALDETGALGETGVPDATGVSAEAGALDGTDGGAAGAAGTAGGAGGAGGDGRA